VKTRTDEASLASARSASGGGPVAWRKKGVPIPEESRYDRLDEPSLFLMLEGNLSTATHLTDVYQASSDPDRELSLLQVELEGALAATKAMRRKHIVIP
jgi:hypothetical protein